MSNAGCIEAADEEGSFIFYYEVNPRNIQEFTVDRMPFTIDREDIDLEQVGFKRLDSLRSGVKQFLEERGYIVKMVDYD